MRKHAACELILPFLVRVLNVLFLIICISRRQHNSRRPPPSRNLTHLNRRHAHPAQATGAILRLPIPAIAGFLLLHTTSLTVVPPTRVRTNAAAIGSDGADGPRAVTWWPLALGIAVFRAAAVQPVAGRKRYPTKVIPQALPNRLDVSFFQAPGKVEPTQLALVIGASVLGSGRTRVDILELAD